MDTQTEYNNQDIRLSTTHTGNVLNRKNEYAQNTIKVITKIYVQDTKTFPKCYVGRNGKRNQQKLHIQVCGSLKTQQNQGCQG